MVEVFDLDKHFDVMNTWWEAHGQRAIPIDMIPTYGLFVPRVAAGFLIATDCNLGILEFFVTNPKAQPMMRDIALDKITSGLIKYGESIGITNFKADTQITRIKERAEKHGFKYLGEFSNYFLSLQRRGIMGGVAKAVGGLAGGVFGGLAGGLAEGAGLGNQYQAGVPEYLQQRDLLEQIKASQGAMNPVTSGQQVLAQALLAQSQGQGPNPAALMMKQAQDRANMQSAGMLASAKGINPALAARMSAQNMAAGNQGIAQQSGILGAQQQLAAQGQLGNLYGQMGQQNLNQQQILQNALANQVSASTGTQGINAQVAAGNAQQRAGLVGGLLQAGGAMGAAALRGPVGAAHGAYVGGKAQIDGDSPLNDTVPAMLSPGEIVIPRSHAKDADSAKAFVEHLLSEKRKGKKKGA